MSVSMIVITGRKDGGITVSFANTDWSQTWARGCGSLEEAFQAVRDELKPRLDNVFHLSREGTDA